MTRCAVLLRGVNVGGGRKVAMATWRARLQALGHEEVVTYLQSGQAALSTTLSPRALASQVQEDLAAGMGVDTAVLVRTHAQLQAVVDGCPWPGAAEASPTTVHAVFLDGRPTGWVATDPDRYAPERAVVAPGVVYLLLPDGMGRTRTPPVEGGTARNWRTVLALLELTAG